jgi:hypothetical protein
MAENNGNIGLEYVNTLYNEAELVTEEPQPIYILHKDTIKTFLHEKREVLSIFDRMLAIIGVLLTVIVTLFSATFNDFLGLPGNVMQGIFIVSTIFLSIWLLITIIKIIKNIKSISIDNLCKDLGKRGTIIKPTKNRKNDLQN